MKQPRGFGRWPLWFLRSAVTLFLLYFLLARIDWHALPTVQGSLNLSCVALAGCCFVAIAMVEAVRLSVVLAPFGLPLREFLKLHVVGTFFGNFLPGQVGADLYKVVALRPTSGGLAGSASLILVLRLIGLFTLVGGAVVAVALEPTWIASTSFAVASQAEPSALVVAVAVVLGAGAVAAVATLLRHDLLLRFKETMRELRHESWTALRTVGAAQIAMLVLLSMIILALRVGVLYFLVLATGTELSFPDGLLIVSLAALVMLVPISIAGLGVREGLVVFGLTSLAVSYEDAVLVAFLGRAFIILISIVGGAWLVVTAKPGEAATSTDRDARP